MGAFSEKAKKIDMYAGFPSLSFGKDGKVYSRLGLLLTFLTIIIIGGMAIWIGISIFGRHKPAFVQYELPAKVQNPKLQWDTDDFRFGVLLSSYTGATFDWPKLVTETPAFGQIAESINLKTEKCQFDFMPGFDFDCFSQTEKKGKTVLDTMGSYYFVINYDFCAKDATATCETEADTRTKLKNDQAIYLFGYNDLLVDPFNFENPISTTEAWAQDSLLLSVGRTLVVTLNEVEFISDNGWLFEDLKTETKLKPTIATKVSDVDMFNIQITYGGTKTVYKRTYPKIQDFLAQVSGFITIITPIFLILVGPYVGLRAVQQMVNEIYEIKLNKPNNNGDSPQKPSAKRKRRSGSPSPSSALHTETALVPRKTSGGSKKNAVHHKNPSNVQHTALDVQHVENLPTPQKPKEDDYDNLLSPEKPIQGLVEHAKLSAQDQPATPEEIIENNDDIGPDEDWEEDIPMRTSDTLEVPWQDWLRSFWRPNAQVKVLNKAKEHIMETFDLLTLSKKVVEIDKLKACLLTHDERVIFENLPSSVIVLDPNEDLKSEKAIQQYHWKDSFKGDEKAVRLAYSNLKGTQKKLGKRLIKLYESEYLEDGDAMVRKQN